MCSCVSLPFVDSLKVFDEGLDSMARSGGCGFSTELEGHSECPCNKTTFGTCTDLHENMRNVNA